MKVAQWRLGGGERVGSLVGCRRLKRWLVCRPSSPTAAAAEEFSFMVYTCMS